MISNHISEIRDGINKGLFTNEAAISQGIVLRLLAVLKWPTYDTRVVFPEYSLSGKRVDFALCHPPNKPLIFIEVKQNIEKSDLAERQLFEYAFHTGVPMAVLTDGREWHFFLPGEQGDYTERRLYKLDILERDISEIENRIKRYLEYERICSGIALEDARKDYKDIARDRIIKNTLPQAWIKIIEEEDDLLLELIADRTESLCGYKPNLDTISDFLKNINLISIPSQKTRQIPIKTIETAELKKPTENITENKFTLKKLDGMGIGGGVKPTAIEINGQKKYVKDWTELSVYFVKYLIKNGLINRTNVPILNSAKRDKYFINIERKHLNPEKDGGWQEVDGYYIDTKYSSSRHIKNMIYTLEYLSIKNLSIFITLKEA
jgi:predicted type IV restriction endonuclease